MCIRTYQEQLIAQVCKIKRKHEIGKSGSPTTRCTFDNWLKPDLGFTSVLKCKLVTFMITLRQFFVGSHEPFRGLRKRVSQHPQQDAHAFTFLVAWVPLLYPFFSFLLTCLRDLHLPVPVLVLLICFTDQLYLLFLAWKPPPVWASFLFWRWKLDLPEYLEMA